MDTNAKTGGRLGLGLGMLSDLLDLLFTIWLIVGAALLNKSFSFLFLFFKMIIYLLFLTEKNTNKLKMQFIPFS